jgi:hypothetical protein
LDGHAGGPPEGAGAIAVDRARHGGAQRGDLVEDELNFRHRRLGLLDSFAERIAERERPERPRPERIGERR